MSVTRSIGSIPANFDIQVTEHCPLAADVTFNPGDPCQVLISGDVVITGYVDRYIATISATAHTVRISGRSKSEDLVDCSAFVGSKNSPTFQVLGGTALSIAQQLAQPYGVAINSIAGPGMQIPQFNIDFGQTPWEIIDRITRYSQLIAYDMPDGSVRLAQAGTESMASGFYRGQNVEQGPSSNLFNGRALLSDMRRTSSAYAFSDQGAGQKATQVGDIVEQRGGAAFPPAIHPLRSSRSWGIRSRHRRAVWECNRSVRAAVRRSSLTCDTWRERRSALWAVNHNAPIRYPIDPKVQTSDWLIASVTFTRDETGQHAQITMMAPGSFDPEPVGDLGIVLLQDTGKNNPTSPEPSQPTLATGGRATELPSAPSLPGPVSGACREQLANPGAT